MDEIKKAADEATGTSAWEAVKSVIELTIKVQRMEVVFSLLEFLFFFFPLVLIAYILIKPQYANMWLLLMSIYFYGLPDKSGNS